MNRLSELTFVELLNMEREYEFPDSLEADAIKRGVEAEIAVRDSSGRNESKIRKLESQLSDVQDESEDYRNQVTDLEEYKQKWEQLYNFITESTADIKIKINILEKGLNQDELRYEFTTLHDDMVQILDEAK